MLSVLLVTLKCDAFLSAHFSWAMGGPGTRQWQVGTCMLNYQACSHSLVPVRTFMSCCCSYCQGQLSLLNLLSQTFPLIFIWHPNCLSLSTSLSLSHPPAVVSARVITSESTALITVQSGQAVKHGRDWQQGSTHTPFIFYYQHTDIQIPHIHRHVNAYCQVYSNICRDSAKQ